MVSYSQQQLVKERPLIKLISLFLVALAFGVETSAMANNFVTCVNIFILGFVIIAGAIKGESLGDSYYPPTIT